MSDNNVHIKIQRDEGATIPSKAHFNDTGYDITITEVEAGEGTEEMRIIPCSDPDYSLGGLGFLKRLILRMFDIPMVHKLVKPRYVILHTGIHVQPEEGYWTMVVPNSRSGKRPFILGNCVGIIDEGYTGEIRFVYKVMPWGDMKDIFKFFYKGAVCGQLIVMKRYNAIWHEVAKLNDTVRGNNGFGSTEARS